MSLFSYFLCHKCKLFSIILNYQHDLIIIFDVLRATVDEL